MSNTEKKGLTKEEVIAVITQEIPRLISEHPEVRYELIGVMSEVFVKKDEHTEILTEIKALREASNRHTQEINRNTQELKALREDFNAMSQQIKEISQQIKALYEIADRHTQELKALREDFHDFRKYTERKFRDLDNKIVGLGARWGIMSEESFREGLKALLTEEIGLEVEHYEGYDDEGIVFVQPDQVEVDLIVKDDSLILVEIKSSMSRGDVDTFQRKVEFYEKKQNLKVGRKVIISPGIDYQTVKFAQSLGMEVYTSALETPI